MGAIFGTQAVKIEAMTPVVARPGKVPEGSVEGANVYMLITSLDYNKSKKAGHLTCTMDGNNIKTLADKVGVTELKVMFNEECQKAAVKEAMQDMIAKCDNGDYFIYYYSGHGIQLREEIEGDEEDGKDECFAFVDENGEIGKDAAMRDNEFREILQEAYHENDCDQFKMLIITDCCHSGSISDLDDEGYEGMEVVAFAGCKDSQTSGDTGNGGIMTHSLLMALDKIKQEEPKDLEHPVAFVYNAMIAYDDTVFNSEQEISVQHTSSAKLETFGWPLMPKKDTDWNAPMHAALSQYGGDLFKTTLEKGGKKKRGLSKAAGSAQGAVTHLATAQGAVTHLATLPEAELHKMGLNKQLVEIMNRKPIKAIPHKDDLKKA